MSSQHLQLIASQHSIHSDDDLANAHTRPKNETIRGILTCVGGILIFLSLGSIYTFGNMLPYFASYLSTINDDADYLTYLSRCDYIFALTICGQSVLFPIGGQMGSKFGIKLTIIIGAVIQSVCGVLCTYFVCNNYILIYLTYGLLFGAGIGISYPNILALVMRWYPMHKGLVNGIVLCGFGTSALIFDKVQTVLINPHNYPQNILTGYENHEIIANFPRIFLYLGASFLVMQIIGVLLMSHPQNEDIHNKHDKHAMDEERAPLITVNDDVIITNYEAEGFDMLQVLKSVRFWHLYVNFFLDGLIIMIVSTQWKIFTNELGVTDDTYLSLIGSVSAIFNGFGRIIFGFILDKTKSYRYTLGCVNILLCILLFLWPFCINETMAFIWVCLLFLLFSSNFSIFPTIVSQSFGTKNVATNIGLIFTSQIFSALVGIYALDQLSTILNNWRYLVFIVASVQFLGALLAFAFKPDINDEKDSVRSLQNDKKC